MPATHGQSWKLSDNRFVSYCGKVIPGARIRADRMMITCPDCYRAQKRVDDGEEVELVQIDSGYERGEGAARRA